MSLVLRKNYQDGLIEYSLKDDSYIDEAIKILKDTSKYNNILFIIVIVGISNISL